MSNTYLDRKNSDVPYVLISYSHKDKNDIERVLTALNEKGADFWYDKELNGGDDWKERVQEATSSKNCVGIVYFMSAEFVFSAACCEELDMLDELKKTHEKFDAVTVLVGETTEKASYVDFMGDVGAYLFANHGKEAGKIADRLKYVNEYFQKNGRNIYYATCKPAIDNEEFVDMLFDKVFKNWGCASEEVESLDALLRSELTDRTYRVKTNSKIITDRVIRKDAEWKVFAYKGDTISAILMSDELYGETCLSLAENTMDGINERINILNTDADNALKKEKHFEFDEKFYACLKRDGKGRALRYLKAGEREKYFLQLREALEKVSVTDAADDGYFFVEDNKGKILFSDRGSEDVYRHIHVDAYASVFPVMDIDYVKYRKYVLDNDKA